MINLLTTTYLATQLTCVCITDTCVEEKKSCIDAGQANCEQICDTTQPPPQPTPPPQPKEQA